MEGKSNYTNFETSKELSELLYPTNNTDFFWIDGGERKVLVYKAEDVYVTEDGVIFRLEDVKEGTKIFPAYSLEQGLRWLPDELDGATLQKPKKLKDVWYVAYEKNKCPFLDAISKAGMTEAVFAMVQYLIKIGKM